MMHMMTFYRHYVTKSQTAKSWQNYSNITTVVITNHCALQPLATAMTDPRGLHELRKQLLALDYDEPLGTDSAALVGRLFADLVATTESYEALLRHEGELSQEVALTQAQLHPLRKDNTRLTRENNALHLELVKREEHVARVAGHHLPRETESTTCHGHQVKRAK